MNHEKSVSCNEGMTTYCYDDEDSTSLHLDVIGTPTTSPVKLMQDHQKEKSPILQKDQKRLLKASPDEMGQMDDEMILPATTSTGETLSPPSNSNGHSKCAQKFEKIYSSLPPDLNTDVMTRSTRTPQRGVHLIVSQISRRLLIKLDEDAALAYDSSIFDLVNEHSCVVCGRIIERGELFLNFPEDLDRRRSWGSAFGFRYTSMLRVKSSTGLTSGSYICTDHFSEECFRRFNFNKAAIETFGVPIITSSSIVTTPHKKRTPWDCTVCQHKAYSVYELQQHMLEHCVINHKDANVEKALREKGMACPFCRRCTYGYRTMSGFVRHLQTPPTAHFYLKRIFDIAFRNCRSAVLDPVERWESWTERNVVFAYHGCEPQSERSPMKRISSDIENGSGSPVKRIVSNTPEPKGVFISAPQSHENCQDQTKQVASVGVPSGRYIRSRFHLTRQAFCPMGSLSSNSLVADDHRSSSGNLLHLSKTSASEESVEVVCSTEGITECERDNTIAAALKCIRDVHPTEENLQTTILDTNMTDSRILGSRMRKTQRQIEANEARLRLFGDCTYVEVPTGYEKVQTAKGVRLVSRKRRSHEQQATPSVTIANLRFEPIN